MFKNVGILFEKRRRLFQGSQDKSAQINQILKEFLKEKFGEGLQGCSIKVSYSSKENSLMITADSKIIANELTLQLAELSTYLKKDNIKLNRILIR